MRKFELGDIFVTAGVNHKIIADSSFANFVKWSVMSYASGNWGDTCDEDKILNDEAVKSGNGRILAVYIQHNTGHNKVVKIWIITEADRSATTILFPEEY